MFMIGGHMVNRYGFVLGLALVTLSGVGQAGFSNVSFGYCCNVYWL